VTGHYWHIVDVGLCIAGHAKALRILISEIEARRTLLHLYFGLWHRNDRESGQAENFGGAYGGNNRCRRCSRGGLRQSHGSQRRKHWLGERGLWGSTIEQEELRSIAWCLANTGWGRPSIPGVQRIGSGDAAGCGPEPGFRLKKHGGGGLRLNFSPGSVARSLGGEAFGGERLVWRRVRHIGRLGGSFFLDLGEQPGLDRGGRPLLLRMIVRETASLEDYGAQLGDAAATCVVEMHKPKAGPGHRILQQRDRRRPRQAMLAAQMQKSADKAAAAVSVVITTARPVAVVGKMLEHEVEELHRFCDFRFRHWLDRFRLG
jgi:hypothetical protein